MKITDVRARVVEWRRETTPPQPHFCTNPVDLLQLPADTMKTFRFHWYIFKGEPVAKDGYVEMDERAPGLGLHNGRAGTSKI